LFTKKPIKKRRRYCPALIYSERATKRF
jgi:hypothetical protein